MKLAGDGADAFEIRIATDPCRLSRVWINLKLSAVLILPPVLILKARFDT